MRIFIYIVFVSVFLIGCRSNKTPTPPERVKLEQTHDTVIKDSILYWSLDSLKTSSNSTNLSEVLKQFEIKKGKLYNTSTSSNVSEMYVQLATNLSNIQHVYVLNGLAKGIYYNSKGKLIDWRTFNYDNNGNIDGDFTIANYTTLFKHGTGYWKDFYFKELDQYNHSNFVLKTEGTVKNNFKFGKWTYYNNDGKVSSTKTYSLKDSVDVRFPHCLFNSNEPCF